MDVLNRSGEVKYQCWVKEMTAHLLDILVVLGLSPALKLMLLIEHPVSQFAGECVNDFSGRGG